MRVNEKQITETDGFKTFAKEIDFLTEFVFDLSELISTSGRIISYNTDKGYFNFNTSLIDSSVQTLRSIKLCCSIGSFSDANTLTRKLRDDLIQYIYILNIINLRKPFLEESIQNLKIDNAEEFANSFLNLKFNPNFTEDEQAVSAWFHNAVSELKHSVRKKLEFENYMNVLKQNENISHILTSYNLQEYWGNLRKKLNNYVHNNGTQYSMHNLVSADNKNLETHLSNVSYRTSYITSFFLVLLLMVESSLISSTDYIDHLDCGLEPPEDSQYFIAGFIQTFIDTKITTLHPELKKYLIDNNVNGMKIE